tara:strand:- start:157 stop:591 length:435 start_codon:yes stop_codon:yes gene_type:complete
MKVRFKKTHELAVTPAYATTGDACVDLHAASVDCDSKGNIVYDTGIAMEIPEGHVGLLFPRSSISKTSMMLRNSVGVIDSGYRGTIKLKFKSFGSATGEKTNIYNPGDRVGQIMIIQRPEIEFEEVDDLTESERGQGGFGSTGA